MFGLYEHEKKYFVHTQNTCEKNKLIVQSVDNNIDILKSVHIVDITSDLQIPSKDISDDKLMIQDDILDESFSCNLQNESISDDDNSNDNVELNEDINEDLEKPDCYTDNFTYNSDIDKVPDSCYNADSENSEEESDTVVEPTKSNDITHKSFETLNVTEQKTCDDIDLRVECSVPKGRGKRNFCYYCKKMLTKIARHFEQMHRDEEDVKKFMSLPKGNQERQKIIKNLRRKGNHLFNLDPAYNNGELIVCRRPTESGKKTACDFICCTGCKGFFSKSNIRQHFRKCTQRCVERSVNKLGRIQDRIHECANSILRNEVFPVLREDDIIRLIRYDELLITYGNKLCVKLTEHHHDLIRSRLRLLGRFLQTLQEINKNVTDFYSIYHPSIYDDCITAINQLAGFNTNIKIYTAPSVASTLCPLLREVGNLGIAECIKHNKLEKKINIENFLKLYQDDFHTIVNKNVRKSIVQAKRNRLRQLLSSDDVKLLHNFLQTNRRLAFQQLKDAFTYNAWRQLAEFTLISIQVFNRQKAGAIEQMSIDDYMHAGNVPKRTNLKIYTFLPAEAQKKVRNVTAIPRIKRSSRKKEMKNKVQMCKQNQICNQNTIADCDAIGGFKNTFGNGRTRPHAFDAPNGLPTSDHGSYTMPPYHGGRIIWGAFQQECHSDTVSHRKTQCNTFV
ncbi:uncharacterized protein LOC105204461 isoform X3 [Solenopsis invicta]|uniref:uncharacterized protein LOC105204461 isoform X3 n=1 Tax=Solenopsis invicta TaxID=13686 RepID=UPI00193E10E7|nr:uncharacterized protein LOC105204461 isoform X3 [Solenopsis invicta]XP_039302311.1 uncharacterized protein LOC105204461 isoform X3 [Solenopsis invicta]